MTRVENFAPPPPNLSNSFTALADKPIEILGKNSDSSESNLVACEELTLSDNPSKRTSARSNKATTESLKDEQKVFSAINRPTAVPGTAASSAPSSVPTAVSSTAAPPAPPMSNDMDLSPVEGNSPAPPAVQLVTMANAMSHVRERLSQSDPDLAVMIETLFRRMSGEIDSLRNSLTFANITSKVLTASAPSPIGTGIKRPHANVGKSSVDYVARNKALVEAWEMKPTLIGGHKRVCTAPTDDPHLNPEEERFMVVHLSVFDLQKGEHRATPTAVLIEKFNLAQHTILNVSPMGPRIQELHIMASKLGSLQAAVARTEGALKLTTKLDPRTCSLGSQDPDAIAKSTAYFKERVSYDIARLSKTNSRRLRSLADFLIQYRDEGLRTSAPINRPRRQQFFASAFLDEAVFDQAASAPTMVAEKI